MAKPSAETKTEKKTQRKKQAKYRRARVRNFLFTVGPNKLSGGRIKRRHLSNDVVVRDVEMTSPLWPSAFDGMRIGHISDFHLGELLSLDDALEIVELLAVQEPDLVACTGDVVDLHHDKAQPLLDAMAQIDAPLGAALVLGNHDELHCGDTVSQMAEDAGMLMLRNDAAEIHHNGEMLIIAGTRWAKSAQACSEQVMATCGDQTHLLLSHNPKSFAAAARHDVALTLSGHTHGGQVAMKNKPEKNLALGYRHSAGVYGRGDSRLYVTAGVGAWFPLRVNCPAEIVMITMRSG